MEAAQIPCEMTTTFLEPKIPTAAAVLSHSPRAMKKEGHDEKD